MKNAILVKESAGQYEINQNAEQENWSEVKDAAESIERIESLMGWGEYTAAYKVTINDYTATYFVEEDSEDAERIFDAAQAAGAEEIRIIDENSDNMGEASYILIDTINAVYQDNVDGYSLMPAATAVKL